MVIDEVVRKHFIRDVSQRQWSIARMQGSILGKDQNMEASAVSLKWSMSRNSGIMYITTMQV